MMSAAAASLRIRRGHRFFRGLGERVSRSSSMATLPQNQTSTSSTGEKIPFLMVSCSSASSPESRRLYKLTKDRYHITNLEPHHPDFTLAGISTDDYCLTGYSSGFLLFRPRSGGNVLAVNPITRARLRLPPVPADHDIDDRSEYGPTVQKTMVVLSPSLETALLLPGDRWAQPKFARLPPSSQWTPFSVSPYRIADCIFHKNRLYIVNEYDTIAAYDEDLFAINPLPSGGLPPSETWTYEELPDGILSTHLVESPDRENVFLVFRCITGGDGLPSATLRCWVYKLDENDDLRVWKPIKSIGDTALFIGRYGGIFVPVRRGDNSSVLEPDCVYFTDNLNCRETPQRSLVDTGIYNLEYGTVEFLPVTDISKILDYSPPVWLPAATC